LIHKIKAKIQEKRVKNLKISTAWTKITRLSWIEGDTYLKNKPRSPRFLTNKHLSAHTCPTRTASSLQGVIELGWFIACSKAYEPRIWIMVDKNLGIYPGRGQEGLKSLTLYIFLEYLWTFYNFVCEWERVIYSECDTFNCDFF
jgi:hypothetical protein